MTEEIIENQSPLVMSFDPKTIDHLGIKMYSQLPNAMAELIANAYDADAQHVLLSLHDQDEKQIVVEDDGIGMTFGEINLKFLRIGRNRREEGENVTPSGRVVTGKKGLGKLAFFGIGNRITVITKKNGNYVKFCLDWEDLKSTPAGKDYKPKFHVGKCAVDEHGTKVLIESLKRKTDFDSGALAGSLAKLFNFSDAEFLVTVTRNDEPGIEVNNKLKYEGMKTEFQWELPDFATGLGLGYEHENDVEGKVVTTDKPLRSRLHGITLFANGRLVNSPEFFGTSESSHFYSYASGWLNVDFIDLWKPDVISTNRQAIDWEHEATEQLRDFLRNVIAAIHKDWRDKREQRRRAVVSEKSKINIQAWFETLSKDIETNVATVVNKVVEDSELSENDQGEVIKALHGLVPEYPKYHWRHLHPSIRKAANTDYQNQDYYRAFIEAAKHYITKTREKSGSGNKSDGSMMGEVYGPNSKLTVAGGFLKPDGKEFAVDTIANIEEGQKFLSMGIVAGGRNPVSHEEIVDLRESGLFSEKDCLDGLSLLSHLMSRLDSA